VRASGPAEADAVSGLKLQRSADQGNDPAGLRERGRVAHHEPGETPGIKRAAQAGLIVVKADDSGILGSTGRWCR
jgi:hypothetical protein